MTDGPLGPDHTPRRVTGPQGPPVTDSAPTVASLVGRNFTDRLAAHLADVKNTDARSRLVRSETDQKVDALQRVVYEQNAEIEELRRRLPGDLALRVVMRANVLSHERADAEITPAKLDALLEILCGPADCDDVPPTKPEQPEEHRV